MRRILIIVGIFIGFCSVRGEFDASIITTGLGRLRGTYMTSRLGLSFYAFRGIPYAKPPVGDLRFRAPEPTEQWNGLLDATQDGPVCPQSNLGDFDMSEDCLKLNVYTKDLSDSPSGKLPVLVFLHPGGFNALSGRSDQFGPEYLMDKDVVLVSFNYRLGALGFLSTETFDAPGNAGLKDQVLVLKWIQLHIHKFGGDPDSVTLMGYSSGALSVTLHMVSPMSKGLFHKAIVMSGSATSQWKLPTHQLQLARKQASLLGCPTLNIPKMMECLRMKDAQEFADTASVMVETEYASSTMLWQPVIEADLGQERFLTDDPTRLFQAGRFMRIPVLAGVTKDELLGVAVGLLSNSSLRHELEFSFQKLAPAMLLYQQQARRSNLISARLKEFYLSGDGIDLEHSQVGLGNLLSDALVRFPVHRFVRLAARFVRVYYYQFTFLGRYSHLRDSEGQSYGVVHYDDLLYLFSDSTVSPLFEEFDPEDFIIERMTSIWSNFASTANPGRPISDVMQRTRWRPFNHRRQSYLDIGQDMTMKEDLNELRMVVWKELFPLTWLPGRTKDETDASTPGESFYLKRD